MSVRHIGSSPILLLCACILIFNHAIFADSIGTEQNAGNNMSANHIPGAAAATATAGHADQSRLATPSRSLLADWKTVNDTYREINSELEKFDVLLAAGRAIHGSLAVSFGNLTGDSAMQLNNHLKIIIAGTLRTFNRKPELKKTWMGVVGGMKNNPLMVEVPGVQVHREVTYEIDNYVEVNGRFDPQIIVRFKQWFLGFLEDNDVRQDTSIDADSLARVAIEIGSKISSYRTFGARQESEDKDVVDIAVLRLPDPNYPFMKIYRIQLKVWRSVWNSWFSQDVVIGVKGVFDSSSYEPRPSIMAMLGPQIVQQSNRDVDALFG